LLRGGRRGRLWRVLAAAGGRGGLEDASGGRDGEAWRMLAVEVRWS
jgi:hypothetical protein